MGDFRFPPDDAEITGSPDGFLVYRTEPGPWYWLGIPDPSPETTAAIRRIQAELDA